MAPSYAKGAPAPLEPLGQRPATSAPSTRADGSYQQPQSWLNGVSCPNATFCLAVGWIGASPMAEFYIEGESFFEGLPEPGAPAGTDNPSAVMNGVSCTSPSACMAVGTLTVSVENPPQNGPYGYSYVFADQWNGSTWTLETPPGGNESSATGVSCAAGDCTMVGDEADATSTAATPLADQWTGSEWSAEAPVDPGPGGLFKSVSCLSASVCFAVGYDEDGNTLAEKFDVSGWGDMGTTDPNPDGQNQFQGVSCTSDAACTAVGQYSTTSGPNAAFAQVWDGANWVPSSPQSLDAQDSYLADVSCLTKSTCVAGGWNWFGPGASVSMIQQRQGTTWTYQNSPNGPSLEFNQLYGISCATAKACMAVGGSWNPAANNGDGTYVPLLLQWNGTQWTEPLGPQLPPVDGAPQPSENPANGNPSEPGTCPSQGSAGDPCNTADGSFSLAATDLSLAGRGPTLEASRSYSTVLAGTAGPLGYGWSLNLAAHLTVPSSVSSGSVATFTQENGAQVAFTYDGSNWSAAPRVQASLAQNGNGTWTVVRDARTTFTFTSAGQLTSESDLNGHTLTYAYTGANLTTVNDDTGRALDVAWSGSHISSITDPNVSPHRVVHYSYDSAGDLAEVTDVNGGHTRFSYNAAHQMTTWRDANCVATSGCPGTGLTYDKAGQVSAQTDPLGRKTTFAYTGSYLTPQGGTTLITDPMGHQTLETYQYGLRVAVTQGDKTAAAATTTLRYDPATLGLITSVDPDGHTTTMSYDSNANLLTETDPLGDTTTWTYNDLNEHTTVTDPNGVTTTDTYDAEGNLTGVSTPCGDCNPSATQTTTYAVCQAVACAADHHSYAEGDVESMTDPDGDVTDYSYDRYGDLAGTTDPDGDLTTQTYDADGWLRSTVAADGNVTGCGCASHYTTTYSYVIAGSTKTDGFGDVQAVTDPLGHVTTYHYDADRNLVSTTDPEGNTTGYVYDLGNEQVAVDRPGGTTVRTDYNADGAIADDRNGANTVIGTYGYDSLGRLTSATDAAGNTTNYTYDPAGNQLTTQAPGGNCAATTPTGCTTFGYDAANRLSSITYSDGITPDVLYAYDADGQRTGMTDGTGGWSWTYDDLHRITSVTEGDNGVVSYQYDLRGSLTSITYPDENSVMHGYDAAGRWTSVTDWLGNKTAFGYDPSGALTTETLPAGTGLVDTFGYNDAGQMTASSVNQGASTLLAADYGRDSDGLVSSDTSQPASSQFYGYTPLNQLCSTAASAGGTCATPPAGASSYAYDAADDPTTDAGTTQVFNNDDQLCWTANGTSGGSCASPPSGATVYTYNSSGERTTVTPAGTSPTTMGYDQAGSLTSLTGPATSATYTYNGDGLLATEKVGKKTTRDTWDLSGSMPVLMGAGSAYYVDGPDGLPLEQITGSTVLWLHHDQLGSTRLVTNATGTAVAGYTYGATGTLTSSTGTASATQLLYTGQYLDPASGLYDMRARDYDPATDQFITADPLASLTRQPYEYADDDPLNDVDPTGLGYCPDGVGIPFTDLCLDNPLDLSQDVQNFDQNSAALDNTPLGGFLENFDPFYGDIRDVIYWVQGCQVNVESDLFNTASAFAPGPSDVEGVLHEGGQAAFAGRLAQVTNYKVGSVLYNNRQVVDELTEAGAESGLGAAPFLPSSGSGCSCGM